MAAAVLVSDPSFSPAGKIGALGYIKVQWGGND